MSITETTQRQLIRNRIHDITDLAMDINLKGHHDATVQYQPTHTGHGLVVIVRDVRPPWSATKRSGAFLEIELPSESNADTPRDTYLARMSEAIDQLRELLQEGQS